MFEPASVDRGSLLRACLTLALNYQGETEEGEGSSQTLASSKKSTGSRQDHHTSFWIIDLSGQVSRFPGLFRLKVYPDDESHNNAIPPRSGVDDTLDHEALPEGDPLVDYEIGVFEEKKFQVDFSH